MQSAGNWNKITFSFSLFTSGHQSRIALQLWFARSHQLTVLMQSQSSLCVLQITGHTHVFPWKWTQELQRLNWTEHIITSCFLVEILRWRVMLITALMWLSYFLQIKRGQVPVIYYTNLLITTLLQLFTMIALVANSNQLQYNSPSVSCYAFSMMANLGFKICISLEGYMSFFVLPFYYSVKHPYGQKYKLLSCVADLLSSSSDSWTASEKLWFLCWLALWSGSFALLPSPLLQTNLLFVFWPYSLLHCTSSA